MNYDSMFVMLYANRGVTVEDQKRKEESVRRNAFSLALWEGKSDDQADAKATTAVEQFRKEQEGKS